MILTIVLPISLSSFTHAFTSMDRDNFTKEGYKVLFDHIESIEEVDNEIELDVIQLCGEFSEYPAPRPPPSQAHVQPGGQIRHRARICDGWVTRVWKAPSGHQKLWPGPICDSRISALQTPISAPGRLTT